MRILMVGAGAVGVVLTRCLEITKSNDVTYYVRSGRRRQLGRIKLLDARSGELHVRERPTAIEPSQPMPAVDTVVLAVRGDQLDEAAAVIERVPADARIATATPGRHDVEKLRARFAGRTIVQITPMFFAYPDGDVFRWWSPPVARTLISDEGDAAARPFAEEMTAALAAGGLPVRAVQSIARAREVAFAAGMPVLASFELAEWDADKLAKNPELRALAARAMREALRGLGGPASLLALAPSPLLSTALCGLPLLSKDTQAMWRVHGPKIARQTRQQLDELLATTPGEALRELRRRLDAAGPH